MKVTIDTEDEEDPVSKLCALNYLRCGLETLFSADTDDTRLVKSSDLYLFAHGSNAGAALRIALQAKRMCESYNEKFSSHDFRFSICSGLDVGKALILKDDYFGDPANVAFKLAETGKGSSNVYVTHACVQRIQQGSHEGPPDDILGMCNLAASTVQFKFDVGIDVQCATLKPQCVGGVCPEGTIADTNLVKQTAAGMTASRLMSIGLLDQGLGSKVAEEALEASKSRIIPLRPLFKIAPTMVI